MPGWRTLGLALVCAGLASLAWARDDAEQAKVLKDRAERFWNARVQDQWDVVFDLMSVEEQQLAGDRDKFSAYQKEKGWFRYTEAKVGDAFVEGDIGWVDVTFTTGLRLYPTMPSQQNRMWDVWRKSDQWRPLPRPLLEQYPTRPPSQRPTEEEAVVTKRLNSLWEAREAQDWPAIYEFLEPAYRKAVSKEEFLKRKSKYLYLSHKIEWVEVNGQRARTRVSFVQRLNDPTLYKLDPEDQVASEAWVKVDDQWYKAAEVPRGGNQQSGESR